MFDLIRFTRYYYSLPSIIFQDEEREDLMDDFEAQLERENRIRELKAKKRKLSKRSWSLHISIALDFVTKEKHLYASKLLLVNPLLYLVLEALERKAAHETFVRFAKR